MLKLKEKQNSIIKFGIDKGQKGNFCIKSPGNISPIVLLTLTLLRIPDRKIFSQL